MPSTKSSEKLNAQQVKMAVSALKAFDLKSQQTDNQEKKNLLENDGKSITLIIGTLKMPDSGKIKPIRMYFFINKSSIPNPLLTEFAEVCLITKDPQRLYKDLVAKHDVKSIKKVIGVDKLRLKYKPYESKRILCGSYDLFLADERVLPILPKLLGKTFFDKKRHPIPVNLTKTNLKRELERTIQSTFLHLSSGCCK